MDRDSMLYAVGIRIPFRDLVLYSLLASLILFSIVYVVYPKNNTFKAVLLAVALAIPPSVAYFLPSALYQRKKENLEQELPLALMELSVVGGGTLVRAVETLASSNYKEVREEFRGARELIRRGVDPEKAVLGIADRVRSPAVRRCLLSLIRAYRSGGDLKRGLMLVVEDVIKEVQMMRERRALFSLQKYIILTTTALFVPLVLGLSLSVVKDLGAEKEIVETVEVANYVYLLLISGISSLYVSHLEGRVKNWFVYMVAVSLLALVVYSASGGLV